MRIFHSKHQKLILQCYPPGKGVDKKPNPSELSYLLYYASTRRVKLEKVITFLDRKTYSDANHSRAGNLQVTLNIVSSLIERCWENLNVFASYVCSILQTILKTKDLALCKSVLNTYGVFCSKLDGGLFSGDKGFVDAFTSLSQNLIEISAHYSNAPGPNQLEWKMISLMACRHISSCLGHNAKLSKRFIGISISLFIETVHKDITQHSLLARLNSTINVEVEVHRLSKVVSSKTTSQVNKQIQENFDNNTIIATDLTEEAFRGLRALFNTTLTSQIVEATQAVVKYNYESGIGQAWGATFLEMCTTWIPVQLRFITLVTLLSKLTSLSGQSSESKTDYDIQTLYANYILGLVSSDVNMIGLSISDIIQQLLALQSNLLLIHSDFLKEDEVKRLSLSYSNCICNLSTHIYYYDQVPDSIQEILIKIDSVLEYSFTQQKFDSEKLHSLMITLLEDISIIFSNLKKKPSSITRNHVTLDRWGISLILLSPETEFENKKSVLSEAQITNIQIKYLKVFHDFLHNEFLNNDERTGSAEMISTENLNVDTGAYSQPDFNQYISKTDNFISHLLIYVDKYFENHEYPNTEIIFLLLGILKDMMSLLGINFICNFIPFFYHWVLPLNRNSYPQNSKYKDTIGYTILYSSLKLLDKKYPVKLEGYSTSSTFFSNLLIDIEYRRLNKLWIHGLSNEPSDEEIIKNGNSQSHQEDGILKFTSTRKNLQEFVSGNSFTTVWINPHRPLILDVMKANQSDTHNRGNINMSTIQTSSNSTASSQSMTEVIEDSSRVQSPQNQHFNGLGLGLGTAGDITSIHSELLLNNHPSNGRNIHSNGSLFTSDGRHVNSPRAADLRDIMLEHKVSLRKPSYNFGDNFSTSSTPGSILSKQMTAADVNSILGGLDSDDDSEMVV